jgi:hypothetical protein
MLRASSHAAVMRMNPEWYTGRNSSTYGALVILKVAKKIHIRQFVILRACRSRATTFDACSNQNSRRRTAKDLQWQRLWQEQRG